MEKRASQSGRKIAKVVVMIGVVLLLSDVAVGGLRVGAASGNQASIIGDGAEASRKEGGSEAKRVTSAVALLAVIGGAIVVGGLIAALGAARAVRRARDKLLRRPVPATPADDVWAKHVVPEWDDESEDSIGGKGG